MLVYLADKTQFLNDCDNDEIEEVIQARLREVMGKSAGKSEVRSWRESLTSVSKVLRDDEIAPDIGVAVELHIPQSAKRIDVTLAGFDAEGRKQAVLVELKQWEQIQVSPKDAIVRTVLNGGLREVVHPSYQAWSYAALLEGFNEAVHSGDIGLASCAYLHNYVRDGKIDAPHYQPYVEKAPLFLKGAEERAQLREFIKKHVKRGGGKDILFELANGRLRPSKALSDSLRGLMAGKPEFILIDDQKEVYEAAVAAAMAASAHKPRVIVVRGGPGTGKTVLAINLLVRLIGAGLSGQYVSKNAAPRKVYEARLTGSLQRGKFAALFAGSGTFTSTPHNSYDFLVVDEAHRLNEKSGLFSNLGENQVKELINAARCTIFFIDEDQRVAFDDVGSSALIEQFAQARGADVEFYNLASQFRCGGSDGYLAWLDDVLQIRETANKDLAGTAYDFQVFDDPQAMHQAIAEKNGGNRARVVAGYCWPWDSKGDPKAMDIAIGAYRRQWNLEKDGSLWIMAPESVDQVGCIHTCQGLEVDYIGVIIGPDLTVQDGRVITNGLARDRHDKTIKGFKGQLKSSPDEAKQRADLIIKNTYRTLMTRGMKGCYVYATDPVTREYLRARMKAIG